MRLPQQLLAKRERVEKLIVQIVAAGERDDGGIPLMADVNSM
jgi:hypothetical protein